MHVRIFAPSAPSGGAEQSQLQLGLLRRLQLGPLQRRLLQMGWRKDMCTQGMLRLRMPFPVHAKI